MFGIDDRLSRTCTGQKDDHCNNLYLAVMRTNTNVVNNRLSTVLTNDLIRNEEELKNVVTNTYLIQRNNVPSTDDIGIDYSSLSSLYVADDLMRNLHFLIGENGKRKLVEYSKRDKLPPTTVIGNTVDFPADFNNKSDYFPVRVLNTSGLVVNSKTPALHKMYRIMRKIATNKDLLRLIFSEDAVAKPHKRGFLQSFNFGITSQDVKRYRKNHLCGGAAPTLFGYNLLTAQVGKYILDFDKLCFERVLPQMGLPSIFRLCKTQDCTRMDGSVGHMREIYSRLTRMALCKQNTEMYNEYNFTEAKYTAPEAGTIAIYPCVRTVEPMNMLHPHIDSMNGYSSNYNHTVTFSALFRLSDVEDENIKSRMMNYLDVNENIGWFHVVFIRYSRKVICDLCKPGSSVHTLPNMISESTCAAEKAILTFVKDKQYTDWDYDFLMKTPHIVGNLQRILTGYAPRVKNVEKFDLNKLRVNNTKQCSYTHGTVIMNKLAAVNKRCYDSAAVDQTFCFGIRFGIKKIDHYIVLAMLFGIYSSGPSLYIQALESLMKGQHMGQNFHTREGKPVDVMNMDPLEFCLLVSRQMGYENGIRNKSSAGSKDKRNTNIASSSERRSVHSNIRLPFADEGDGINHSKRFQTSFMIIKSCIQSFWVNVEDELSKKRNSFTKSFAEFIYRECAKTLQLLCARPKTTKEKRQEKWVHGAGEFTSMVFIQFAGVLGILPAECATFGHVSNMKNCGSLKFFHRRLGDSTCKSVTKEMAKIYNQRLHDISLKMRTKLSDKYTPEKIENIACENDRGHRVSDPIYLLGHRKKHYERLLLKRDSKFPTNSSAGIQNFFDVVFDKSKGRMRVCIARANTTNGTHVLLTPLSDYIVFHNNTGTVRYTSKVTGFMPYNAIVQDTESNFVLLPVG